MNDEKKHHVGAVLDLVREVFGAGTGISQLQPSANDQLTEYVEWVVVHKGCGKPLTGMSPRNGWCYCLASTGQPPEMAEKPQEPAKTVESTELLTRCQKAEQEITKLTEKLEKASKKIAELVKKEKGTS
jgi:hypothetical protein